MEHLFYGNKSGGLHYNGLEGAGEIVEVTKPVNEFGVYEGTVEIAGKMKKVPSTFFPDNWTPQDVLDAIEYVCNNPSEILKSGVNGATKEGIEINVFFDNFGKVKTAYPIFK